jgi:hypothetical protein
VDPQTLSTLMVAALLAVGTLGTRYSTQGRRRAREIRRLRRLLDEAEQYIFQLRSLLHRHEIPVPELPPSMTAEGDEDDE